MKVRQIAVASALVSGALLAGTSAHAVTTHYSINFTELNNSGVAGSGSIMLDDVTSMMRVQYTATGLDAGVHAQHIHGRLSGGPGSTPLNSTTPTLAQDAAGDNDGFIETLEGVPTYGDILLSLFEMPGDPSTFPSVDASGMLSYDVTFDLSDPSIFTASPATGNVYSAADLMPLDLREVVIHGGDVPAGVGGGQFEVDGTQPGGFVGLLPVASAEISAVSAPGSLWSMLAVGGVIAAVGHRRSASRRPSADQAA